MIKLSLQDLDAGSRMDRERLRDEFSRFHCVLLPGFLDVRMGERIAKLVSTGVLHSGGLHTGWGMLASGVTTTALKSHSASG